MKEIISIHTYPYLKKSPILRLPDSSTWPEPAEDAGGQQALDQAVEHLFEGERPGHDEDDNGGYDGG